MIDFINNLLQKKDPKKITFGSLPIEGSMPEIDGTNYWFNSKPLSQNDLRGKVVLIDFWTYSCVNCLRTLPYLKAWYNHYRGSGFVIIGVHAPEFDFEKKIDHVEQAIRRLGIEYPVVIDNDRILWNAFKNKYWPAHYFIDTTGKIRYHHFGEGGYDYSEQVIRFLLSEANLPIPKLNAIKEISSINYNLIGTPETYLGFNRMEQLGSPEAVKFGQIGNYSVPQKPAVNVFYFDGHWNVQPEYSTPADKNAKILFIFRASSANLVMEGKGIVEIKLNDNYLTRENSGEDIIIDKDGKSVVQVDEPRLYSLIDTKGNYNDYKMELTFIAGDIKCFAFTFG